MRDRCIISHNQTGLRHITDKADHIKPRGSNRQTTAGRVHFIRQWHQQTAMQGDDVDMEKARAAATSCHTRLHRHPTPDETLSIWHIVIVIIVITVIIIIIIIIIVIIIVVIRLQIVTQQYLSATKLPNSSTQIHKYLATCSIKHEVQIIDYLSQRWRIYGELGFESVGRLLQAKHSPTDICIITQPWHSFCCPTEGERLSRPRHCSKCAARTQNCIS